MLARGGGKTGGLGGGGSEGEGEGGGGEGGGVQSKRMPSTVTQLPSPSVPTPVLETVTVPEAANVYSPRTFHWAPLNLWSTVTVATPKAWVMVTGTLDARPGFEADHQSATR